MRTKIAVILALTAMLAATTGCGGASISPQLASARNVMNEAKSGTTPSYEPDELLVAQRTLEEAEAADDGSPREVHLAYVAERQTQLAMADSRRAEIEGSMNEEQHQYQRELERIARERGEALETTSGELAQRERVVAEQQRAIAERDQALTAEQRARQEAEARADDAMTRLRDLASVRQERSQTIITLSGEVLFETDRAELRPEARDRLQAVADAIRSSEQVAVIAGYTDSRGSDEYNRQLSQRRAESVLTYLLGEGVPADRVRAEGRGEANPIASNESAEGRANNRRVEIVLSPTRAASIDEGSVASR